MECFLLFNILFLDFVYGVLVYESIKCFKWKYIFFYEIDVVVLNFERDGILI